MFERGGVLLEMTLSMVMLIVFATGIIDLGNLIYEESQLTDFLQKLSRDVTIIEDIIINGDPETEYTLDEFLEGLNSEVDERFTALGINPNDYTKEIKPVSFQPANSSKQYSYLIISIKRSNSNIFLSTNNFLSSCVSTSIKINIKNPDATYGVINEAEGYEEQIPYLTKQEDYVPPC